VPNFVSAQLLIGFVHIADYDGDVLEPAVVGARVDGNRPALGGEIFGQFYDFAAELQARHAHAGAENSLQPLVFAARDFNVANSFEG
jgi:hypothetical protein